MDFDPLSHSNVWADELPDRPIPPATPTPEPLEEPVVTFPPPTVPSPEPPQSSVIPAAAAPLPSPPVSVPHPLGEDFRDFNYGIADPHQEEEPSFSLGLSEAANSSVIPVSSPVQPPDLPLANPLVENFRDVHYGAIDPHEDAPFSLTLSNAPDNASILPFPPSIKSHSDDDPAFPPYDDAAIPQFPAAVRRSFTKVIYDPLTSSLGPSYVSKTSPQSYPEEDRGRSRPVSAEQAPPPPVPDKDASPRAYKKPTRPPAEPKYQFQCDVTDPMKVNQAVGSYVVYRVKTQTNSPLYRSSEVTVNRRFSDFYWLFDKLVLQHPGIIIPPVPEKQTLGRFQEEFVESRRMGLEYFMRKVVSHPILQDDTDLRAFLESETFLADESKGFLGVFGGTSSPSTSAPSIKIEVDPAFETRRNRIEAFEPQLRALSRALDEWQRLHADLSLATHEIATSLQQLANIDVTKPIAKNFTALSDIHKQVTDLQEKQVAKHDIVALDSNAQYYIRVVNSVNLAFTSRARAYQAWQASSSALQRKRETLDKLHAARATRSDKITATISEIDELEHQTHVAETVFHNVSANLRFELDRFDADMNTDFLHAMRSFLHAFVESQREITELWESYNPIPMY
ncbi:Vps5 C terminal like-domain-containing protein [Powellomyces hirtus]|nr:Vps5 C terminal like-domain-containing protein [Powellomyces hirtus]